MTIPPEIKKYGIPAVAILGGIAVLYYLYQQYEAGQAANAANAAASTDQTAAEETAAALASQAAGGGTGTIGASTPATSTSSIGIPSLTVTPTPTTSPVTVVNTTPAGDTGQASTTPILANVTVTQPTQAPQSSTPAGKIVGLPTGSNVNVAPATYNNLQAAQADYTAPPQVGISSNDNGLGTSTYLSLSTYLDRELQSAEATGSSLSQADFNSMVQTDAASQCNILGSNDPNCSNPGSVITNLEALYASHIAAINTPPLPPAAPPAPNAPNAQAGTGPRQNSPNAGSFNATGYTGTTQASSTPVLASPTTTPPTIPTVAGAPILGNATTTRLRTLVASLA